MSTVSASSAATYEATLPEWQRWLNTFCENWIFAFLIAMAIRQFGVELFRIPTASMEPMLYGDPGFFKGDQVVVDKLTPRFTGYTRWDVTVFQFPRPELEIGDDARPAINADDQRMDHPLLRPLFCRSFVKRMLAVPGDVIYFAGGDLHRRQADGTFAIERKPPSVQEALWQDIWIQGAQAGYLPWATSGTSQVTGEGDRLRLTLGDQPVLFTQPLRNLYLKPGKVRVERQFTGDGGGILETSMTAPVFTWNGQQGNLWDLDSWKIDRLTAKDLDHGHGTKLNDVMTEFVGDIRLVGTVAALDGTASIRMRLGTVQDLVVDLSPTQWQASINGSKVGEGQAAVVGGLLRMARIDGQLVLDLAGKEVLRTNLPGEVDPTVQRLNLSISGQGRCELSGALLQRDLHYCAKGVLLNDANERSANGSVVNSEIDSVRRDKAAENIRLSDLVRSQFRGKDLSASERSQPWGTSPATAITVPAGCYLLMGDNSPFSWDGRYWGWVTEENLRGRALAVIFPPQRWRVVR